MSLCRDSDRRLPISFPYMLSFFLVAYGVVLDNFNILFFFFSSALNRVLGARVNIYNLLDPALAVENVLVPSPWNHVGSYGSDRVVIQR